MFKFTDRDSGVTISKHSRAHSLTFSDPDDQKLFGEYAYSKEFGVIGLPFYL